METPERQFRWRLSVTHAQGFPPLLLKDATTSYWPGRANNALQHDALPAYYKSVALLLLTIQLLSALTCTLVVGVVCRASSIGQEFTLLQPIRRLQLILMPAKCLFTQ